MSLEELAEATPREVALTIPARQPFSPGAFDLIGKPVQAASVAGDAVVGKMAAHRRRQAGMLFANRLMPVDPAPVGHVLQCPGKAAFGCDLPNHVFAVPRFPPDMGKAEEVERGSCCDRMMGIIRPLEPEVDEARLVGVERKPVPRQTLAQDGEDLPGVDEVVERHDQVIGKPDQHRLSLETGPHLALEPSIQHMVQEDVRKAG